MSFTMGPKAAITLAVAFSSVLAEAATIDKRIIGGKLAKEGEFPYIVRLHYGNDEAVTCGGSLIDSRTVLTAAHCRTRDITSVRAGSLDRNTGGVVSEIQVRLVHPDYKAMAGSSRPSRNDIAILKLSTPIQESQTVRYAKLPASGSDPIIGSTAVAAGWGRITDVTGGATDKLRKVTIPIDAPNECFGIDFDIHGEFQNNLDTKVCAGKPGMDTGAGDSGGPLIDQQTTQLIGVTSFVAAGTEDGRGFYTKVSRYIPWINENLGDSGIDPRAV